jgi:hypothetical protein
LVTGYQAEKKVGETGEQLSGQIGKLNPDLPNPKDIGNVATEQVWAANIAVVCNESTQVLLLV